MKGFMSHLQEATTSLVLSGGSFQSIVNYARMIEGIRQARQGSGKRSCYYGRFGSDAPKDRDSQRQGAQGYPKRPVYAAIPSADNTGRSRSSQTVMMVPPVQGCTEVL